MSKTPVYLDNQSSTQLDPRVKDSIENSISTYGNPHTTSHIAGIEASRLVATARRNIARSIGGNSKGVIFTSGATEANNLVIQGIANRSSNRKKIIVVESEHSSVLEPALILKKRGFEVDLLPVNHDGVVNLNSVKKSINKDTVLLSAMHVNNETGVIQPIEKIAKICHDNGALFHSDCSQSLGKISINYEKLGVDFLTLSSHKCYGPKGIGAIYIREGYHSKIKPLFFGGGQEGTIRPGTLPVPLCVGFGEACRIASQDLKSDQRRINKLAKRLLNFIFDVCPTAKLNGSYKQRIPNAFNICFNGTNSDELIEAFEGIYVSSGSACHSNIIEPSRVLIAYGLSASEADASLRFCVGRFTKVEDIEIAERVIARGIKLLGIGIN